VGEPSCRSIVLAFAALTIAATAVASSDSKSSTTRHERARSLFLDACTACHTLERVRVQRLGKEEWRHLIAGMLSEGVPLTDEETSLLVDYLAENFGPDKPGS
jgi:mono/diheme cytochrome c family protein